MLPMADVPPVPARRTGAAAHLTRATSLLVIGAVGGIYLLSRARQPASDASPAEEQPAGTGLIEGRDYRVMVAVAHVRPEKAAGAKWDSGLAEKAAPDPFYEIWWRGNLVFRSEEVEDALVASWSSVALPKILKLLTDEKISLETVKEGALIQARAGEEIRVKVWDDDPVDDDLIEEFAVTTAELRVGDQVRQGKGGLESVTLRILPRDAQQLDQLFR